VRMTALHAERVIMVAPVRRRDSARRYLGHLRSIWYLIHDQPLLVLTRVVQRLSSSTFSDPRQ
jgi:hypothetical protein